MPIAININHKWMCCMLFCMYIPLTIGIAIIACHLNYLYHSIMCSITLHGLHEVKTNY